VIFDAHAHAHLESCTGVHCRREHTALKDRLALLAPDQVEQEAELKAQLKAASFWFGTANRQFLLFLAERHLWLAMKVGAFYFNESGHFTDTEFALSPTVPGSPHPPCWDFTRDARPPCVAIDARHR